MSPLPVAAAGCCRRATSPTTSSWPTPAPRTASKATPSAPPTWWSASTPAPRAAYVGMTRGRRSNTAHLIAEDLTDAREQWTAVFARDLADLGPAHAATLAAAEAARYAPGRSVERAPRGAAGAHVRR